jgi:predicted transcriptional regulator of viral defense system
MLSTNDTNKVMLTPNEHLVYIFLVKKKVCSLKEISKVTNNYDTTRSTLTRLVKKGYAIRVHRGTYAGIPPEDLGSKYEPDRYLICYIVGSIDGAFGFHSALELHGVANSYSNMVYFISPFRHKNFNFQNVEYYYINNNNLFGIKEIMREGIKIPVTDRERTCLDCFRSVYQGGGIEEIIKSISTFHRLDFKKLVDYLYNYQEQSLIQRSGYFLTIMKDKLDVPVEVLDELKSSKMNRTYYIQPRSKMTSVELNREWNIIVPRNIEEMIKFA